MNVRARAVSQNPLDYIRDHGLRDGLEHLVTYALLQTFRHGFHRRAVPLLEELDQGALASSTEPIEIIRTYLQPLAPAAAIEAIVQEHAALSTELERRIESRTRQYPDYFRIETNSSLLIYTIVRVTQPTTVLETGVANGASTFFLLHALERNGQGTLHSVDVSTDVGGLLAESEKRDWKFHLLKRSRQRERFVEILDRLPPIDFFIHDSDHRYLWQRLELDLVRARMSHRGIIACDDANASFAFPDVAREIGARPLYLVEKRKVFGMILPRGSGLERRERLNQTAAEGGRAGDLAEGGERSG